MANDIRANKKITTTLIVSPTAAAAVAAFTLRLVWLADSPEDAAQGAITVSSGYPGSQPGHPWSRGPRWSTVLLSCLARLLTGQHLAGLIRHRGT